MLLNDMLAKRGIKLDGVLVFRHTPHERGLRDVLPWLADEQPGVFNAYQQTQGPAAQNAMLRARYVASFIGHEVGKAVFIGLYKVGEHRAITREQFWEVPAYQEMKKFGMKGFVDDSPSVLWFDLEVTEFYKEWKGKLIVDWPPPPITWWRWANQKEFPVHAILEDSILVEAVPRWEDIVWSWDKLKVIPAKWRDVLKQWRGIYYIFDRSDRKGYVGAAYGKDNILGRWLNYAASGHGGNTQLRKRAFTAENFSFSILQLMAHDATAEDVRKLESTWKDRLHTRPPFGLNDN